LPRSARGYDAADRVAWPADGSVRLGPDQRSAYLRWQALHALEESGLLARLPRIPLPDDAPVGGWPAASPIPFIMGGYLLALVALGLILRTSIARRHALAFYPAVLVLVGVAASIGLSAGRMGDSSRVTVTHSSSLVQLADGASFLVMKGRVTYPSFEAYTLGVDNADVAVEAGDHASDAWLDANGAPQLTGTFGLGSHQVVSIEGIVESSPLELSRHAGVTRITNRSSVELRECRFPDGFDTPQVGTLPPGRSAETREIGLSDQPFVVCTLPEPPLALRANQRPVQAVGTTLLVVPIPPAPDVTKELR
jgi:hypothetical protein